MYVEPVWRYQINNWPDLDIKLKPFFNVTQPLHEYAVLGWPIFYTITKKTVIRSEAFIVDVSI